MAHLIKKEDFNIFVEQLTNKYNVVGPVFNKKKKMFLFSYLEKGDGIKGKLAFNLPLYPAKDFFLPIKQKFFEFRDGKIKDIREKSKRKTVFFMNRCDINAVHRNDLIMLDSPLDPYYKEKRENAILVEIPCVKEASCHCTNIGLINCYDLKIIDSNGNYILDTLTKKGEELVKLIEKRLYPWAVEYEREKPIPYVEKDVDTENKDVWERYGKDCLSCSACNVVCPTCVCFTIEGHLNLDFRSGHRHREWASCQLPEFTKVAGNFVFRKDRGARGKQRIHCKFFYFKNKYNYARCVGCGRCNLACPVGINIYEYHDALK